MDHIDSEAGCVEESDSSANQFEAASLVMPPERVEEVCLCSLCDAICLTVRKQLTQGTVINAVYIPKRAKVPTPGNYYNLRVYSRFFKSKGGNVERATYKLN